MTVTTESGAAPAGAVPLGGEAPRRNFTFGVAWLAGLLIVGLLLGAGGALWATRATKPGDASVEAAAPAGN